jgi:hypothetical protein
MGGGGVIIILKKVVKDALSVGVSPGGGVKLWHVLIASHALAFLIGLAL